MKTLAKTVDSAASSSLNCRWPHHDFPHSVLRHCFNFPLSLMYHTIASKVLLLRYRIGKVFKRVVFKFRPPWVSVPQTPASYFVLQHMGFTVHWYASIKRPDAPTVFYHMVLPKELKAIQGIWRHFFTPYHPSASHENQLKNPSLETLPHGQRFYQTTSCRVLDSVES